VDSASSRSWLLKKNREFAEKDEMVPKHFFLRIELDIPKLSEETACQEITSGGWRMTKGGETAKGGRKRASQDNLRGGQLQA